MARLRGKLRDRLGRLIDSPIDELAIEIANEVRKDFQKALPEQRKERLAAAAELLRERPPRKGVPRMIRLKSFPDEPRSISGRCQGRQEQGEIQGRLRGRKYPKASDFESKWSDFKYCFEVAQGGKCAFCETKIQASAYGRIDHFRPKSEVLRAHFRGKQVDDTRGDAPERGRAEPHLPGYWWLAYDWKLII